MPDEICHHGICYVKNPGDKYKRTEDYSHSTGITGGDGGNVYLNIDLAGDLEIRASYAWDGPSGPSIEFCRACGSALSQ